MSLPEIPPMAVWDVELAWEQVALQWGLYEKDERPLPQRPVGGLRLALQVYVDRMERRLEELGLEEATFDQVRARGHDNRFELAVAAVL